jgi:uncharacterized phage-associated protein
VRQVSFRFDSEKLVHVLAFFADRGIADLTKLKAAKLLYFLDKFHLWHFGRPVVGGPYFCMPFGPVPGRALQAMNDVIDASEVESPFAEQCTALINEYLEVDARGSHPRFVARRPHNPEVFSRSELQALEHVFTEYGNKSANQLVTLTHDDPTWTIPNEQRVPGGRMRIPYHLFFEDANVEVRQIWRLIESEQEDRETDDPLEVDIPQAVLTAD